MNLKGGSGLARLLAFSILSYTQDFVQPIPVQVKHPLTMQLKTVALMATAALPTLVQSGYIALRSGEGQCYFQVKDIDSCNMETSYFGSSDDETCVQGSSG